MHGYKWPINCTRTRSGFLSFDLGGELGVGPFDERGLNTAHVSFQSATHARASVVLGAALHTVTQGSAQKCTFDV